jgi:hypothetical protein
MSRPLHDIAADIKLSWPKPYFGAVPYLQAMACMKSVNDRFGYDDARMIVNYFLANAGTWKGEDARRVKAELKGML